ncbi:hypothetical protein [Nevskia soli]|uniref:hypothetical protein n=1 Tax=Nevskia soli TaxID=418856 RepID=UPI0015D8CCD6|nr:hypothetical protein [Nevskia soli]
MTGLQLYILVAIPLVGILANTALFVNLASRMDTRFDLVMRKFSELDTRVAVLEDRVMRGSQ